MSSTLYRLKNARGVRVRRLNARNTTTSSEDNNDSASIIRPNVFTASKLSILDGNESGRINLKKNDTTVSKYFGRSEPGVSNLDETDDFVAPSKRPTFKKEITKKVTTRRKRKPKKEACSDIRRFTEDFGKACKYGGVDVDPDQLQLAIALSESLNSQNSSETAPTDDAKNSDTTVQGLSSSGGNKLALVRRTLQQFGFKISSPLEGTSKSSVYRRRKDYSLYKSTAEEKEQRVNDKTSKILLENVLNSFECVNENYETFSFLLKESLCTDKCCISKASVGLISKLDYYVTNLFEPSNPKLDRFLKDWSSIPGREKSPQRKYSDKIKNSNFAVKNLNLLLSGTNREILKHFKKDTEETILENNEYSIMETNERSSRSDDVIKSSIIPLNDDEISNKSSKMTDNELNRSSSPDMFDDSYSTYKNKDVNDKSKIIDLSQSSGDEDDDELPNVYISQCSSLKNNNTPLNITKDMNDGGIAFEINDAIEKKRSFNTEINRSKSNIIKDVIDLSQDEITLFNNELNNKNVTIEQFNNDGNADFCNKGMIDLSQDDSNGCENKNNDSEKFKSIEYNDAIGLIDRSENYNNVYSTEFETSNKENDFKNHSEDSQVYKDTIDLSQDDNDESIGKSMNEDEICKSTDTDTKYNYQDIFDRRADENYDSEKFNSIIYRNEIELFDRSEDYNAFSTEVETSNKENYFKNHSGDSQVYNKDSIDLSQDDNYESIDKSINIENINKSTDTDTNKNDQDVFDLSQRDSDSNKNISNKESDRSESPNSSYNRNNSEVFLISDDELEYSISRHETVDRNSIKNDLGVSVLDSESIKSQSEEARSKLYRSSILNTIYSFEGSTRNNTIDDGVQETNDSLPNVYLTKYNTKNVIRNENNVSNKITEETPSFKTPKGSGYTIKTENVTPMIDYSSLDSPEIREQLGKYGVRPLKRKRAIQILQHIYEQTHPLVDVAQLEINTKKIKLDKKCGSENNGVLKSADLVNCTNRERENELDPSYRDVEMDDIQDIYSIDTQSIFITDIGDCVGDDLIFTTRQKSSKVSTCDIPLHVAFHNYLSLRSKLRNAILRYEPVDVDLIHRGLKSSGHKFYSKDLISFLDKKCITIKTSMKSFQKKRRK